MAKRVAQRYLLAAAAFAVALVWTGIGLMSGFECLLVFTLVYLSTSVVQQRRAVAGRSEGRPRRERVARRAERSRTTRETLSGESGEWPQLAERW